MLEYIHLKNFQTHKDLRIQFDKHVTTIIGDNDTGKSAILRAIRFAFLNKPNGSHFVNWDAKFTRVEIGIDGHKLIRKKGKETNQYILDGHVFEAFGNDVPDAIQALVNVDATNIQMQLESPFWFMLSAGEVAKELNSIINLGLIDRTFANIGNELRKTRSEISVVSDRLKNAITLKDSLEWVVSAGREWETVEEMERSIGQKRIKRVKLSETVARWEELHLTQRDATERFNAISELRDNLNSILEKRRKADRLRGILKQMRECEKRIKTAPPLEEFDELAGGLERIQEAGKRIKRLRTLLREMNDATASMKQHNDEAKKVQRELDKLTDGKCPICGKPNK